MTASFFTPLLKTSLSLHISFFLSSMHSFFPFSTSFLHGLPDCFLHYSRDCKLPRPQRPSPSPPRSFLLAVFQFTLYSSTTTTHPFRGPPNNTTPRQHSTFPFPPSRTPPQPLHPFSPTLKGLATPSLTFPLQTLPSEPLKYEG